MVVRRMRSVRRREIGIVVLEGCMVEVGGWGFLGKEKCGDEVVGW